MASSNNLFQYDFQKKWLEDAVSEVIGDMNPDAFDYEKAVNKPSIEGVVLVGDKAWEDFGAMPGGAGQAMTDDEVNQLL